MNIGFRPKGETGPLYHPDRDYAYITPTLMRIAVERLDGKDLSEEAAAWKEQNKITEEEIAAVVEALARAQRDFVNSADAVGTLEQALSRRDFYAVRFVVRQFLFAAIGEVMCGAWFTAVRDVSTVGEQTPAEKDMVDFAAAVNKLVAKTTLGKYKPTVEAMQMWNDVLQSRCELLAKECVSLRQELQKLTAPPPPPRVTFLSRLKTLLGVSPCRSTGCTRTQ